MTPFKELTATLGITTLMVTHNPEMLPYTNNITTMKDG